jgi:hypothetical protein
VVGSKGSTVFLLAAALRARGTIVTVAVDRELGVRCAVDGEV